MPVKRGKLGPREELITMAGVLIVSVIIWYFTLYAPPTLKAQKLNEEIAYLQDSLNADTRYKAKTTALQVQISKLEDDIINWDSRFPSRNQIVILTKQIVSFFKRSELEVIEVSPSLFELYALEKAGAKVAGQYVMQLPLHFTLRGRYISMGKMLENLENLPFNLTVADISINQKKQFYPNVEVKLGLYLYVHL